MTAGKLEILRYVPQMFLKDKSIDEMEIDEFMDYIAMARYVEELEKENMMRAISEVFSED